MKTWLPPLFAALLATGSMTVSLHASANTNTSKLIIENGSTATSNEEARQRKEQWNDTRTLRQKENRRTEKNFDKTDRAYDTRDACEKSYNVNAYWEPNTLRCLDRRTGRAVVAP